MSPHLTAFIFIIMGVNLGLSLKPLELRSEELFMLLFCTSPGIIIFGIVDSIINKHSIYPMVYILLIYIILSMVLNKLFDGFFTGKLLKLVGYYIGAFAVATICAIAMNFAPVLSSFPSR